MRDFGGQGRAAELRVWQARGVRLRAKEARSCKGRAERADRDLVGGPLNAKSFTDGGDGSFARAVGGLPWHTAASNNARHVDDHRQLAFAKERESASACEQEATNIGRKDLV